MNKLGIVLTAGIVLSCAQVEAQAEAEIDRTSAIRACIGEASNQGYHGLLCVAIAIRNRGTLDGVYGLKAEHIDKEPKWVWDMAEKAWNESKHNRFHRGTFWGSTIYDVEWLNKMEKAGYILVYQHKEHRFYIKGDKK